MNTYSAASVVSTMASAGTTASSPTMYKSLPDNLMLTVVNVIDSAIGDATWIKVVPATSDGFDGQEDAWKLKNRGNMPDLYSSFNGDELAINSIDLSNSKSIAIHFDSPQQGAKFVMNLAEAIHSGTAYSAVLEDRLTNIFWDFDNGAFRFSHEGWNNDTHRFVLHLSTSALSMESKGAPNPSVYQSADKIIIAAEQGQYQRLRILGVDGRLIAGYTLDQAMNVPVPGPSGMYVVQLIGSGTQVNLPICISNP